MENIRKALRNFISRDKRRFKSEGYDLDLTYITEKLIAMALPGKGISITWRNKTDEVVHFLNTHHPSHFRIFCLGKSGIFENTPLQNNVDYFYWPGNCTPSLVLLFHIVNSIDNWLKKDLNNVAVIMAKEGRERTGVVISSYLVQKKIFSNPNDALNYYASMRSKTYEGVTTPSQKRYVMYMSLINTVPNPPRKVVLHQLFIKPIPNISGGLTPIIEIYNSSATPHQLLFSTGQMQTFEKEKIEIPISLNIIIEGDIIIKLYNRAKILGLTTTILMCKLAFHTNFIVDNMYFDKNELDSDRNGPFSDERKQLKF